MSEHTPTPILVTAGTGKTGSRVAQRLEALGVPVRIASRGSHPAFDWEDRSTWDAALASARAVYIAFAPDVAVPGSDAVIRAFTERAIAAGVTRLVLLSGRGEPEAKLCEDVVLSAGVPATVIRASWFLQNFTEGEFAEGMAAGELALPVAPDVLEPFVDADDIAEIAVAALTQDGHAGEVYEVTGPRLLTFPQVVAELNPNARFVPLAIDQFAAAIAADGVPPEIVDLLVYLFTEVFDGRNASLADGVQRALGRPARDVTALATA